MSQRLWGGVSEEDVQNLKNFSKSINSNDHKKSILIAKKMRDSSAFAEAMISIALWNKYSRINNNEDYRNVEFSDISRFVSDNRFFPNLSVLRKNVEKVASAQKIPYSISKQYFKNLPASNAKSKIYLLESEISHSSIEKESQKNLEENLDKEIENLKSNIWINEDFSNQEELEFLTKYASGITQENHISRINRLLWDEKIDDAKRIFYLIDEDNQKLFNAIIAIGKNPKYVNRIITNIPRNLRSNELLAYKVVIWKKKQIKNNDIDDVVEMLLEIPPQVQKPEKWWGLRKLYARELLKTKSYKKAYKLASSHGFDSNGTDFADAEWTSGWIALRFLNKPEIAYGHFHKLYLNVGYPISLSRASYWLGMASSAMGDKAKAIEWYKIATKYPIYFYGQIAIHKHRILDDVGSQSDIILPKDPDILQSDIETLAKQDDLKIAYVLTLLGDTSSATKIFENTILKAKTEGQIVAIMKVANEIKNPELELKVSKAAAKKNVFLIKDKFQIIKDIKDDPNSPLVHAIIKQESGFAPSALSSAGAVGFMQLMPETAKIVSNKIGVAYNKDKLGKNMKYNISLGSFYIQSLIEEFDGSELLAIASYNAGPSTSRRWIREFYDPRKTTDIDKVVDWIELITYSETRNYVQRIMENLIVYRYIMSRVEYDQLK